LSFLSHPIFGQNRDIQLIMGESDLSLPGIEPKSQLRIDFRSGFPDVQVNHTDLNFRCVNNCATICDEETGDILFYTNGNLIMNQQNELMVNGDSFPINLPWEWTYYGSDWGHTHIILPDFTNPNLYYYFYVDFHMYLSDQDYELGKTSLYYLKIDMTKQGGLGEVVEKNIPVLQRDTLKGYAMFKAIRHANGRDWWLLSNVTGTNTQVRVLWTPDGFKKDFPEYTVAGLPNNARLRMMAVSKDGTKVAMGAETGCWVYDFNRCTGILSNPVEILTKDTDPPSGWADDAAFSDNSRYLFFIWEDAPSALLQWQGLIRYDLWDANLHADTLYSLDQPSSPENYYKIIGEFLPLPTGQLGFAGSAWRRFHVLPYPDNVSIIQDTNFVDWDYNPSLGGRQHIRSPNYYLGPIDNSTCDTLGINNEPLAHWRYDRRPNPLEIQFVDLTYYEPTYWHWDFGDGTNSDEQHPLHDFAEAGTYEVCLIVGNQYAADTLCKMVTVGDLLSVQVVADTLSGCAPLQVQYHALTVGANSMHWTFAGGTPGASDEADVLVTYNTAGTFASVLTGAGTLSQKSDSVVVVVQSKPDADYSFDLDGWEMTATNHSTGATAYHWDFGDGATDTVENPVHEFAGAGSYNIVLVAQNECGSDTISRNLTITGTEDLEDGLAFSLYPNPNTGIFEISLSGNQAAPVKLEIFDILGRRIQEKSWTKRKSLTTTINLNTTLPKGNYVYALTFGDVVLRGLVLID